MVTTLPAWILEKIPLLVFVRKLCVYGEKKKKESSEKSFLKNVHPTVMVGDLMAFCTSGVKN